MEEEAGEDKANPISPPIWYSPRCMQFTDGELLRLALATVTRPRHPAESFTILVTCQTIYT